MAIFQIKILKVLVHSGSVAIGCVIFSTSVQNLTSLEYVNYCLKISAVCANLVVLWILKLIFFSILWQKNAFRIFVSFRQNVNKSRINP